MTFLWPTLLWLLALVPVAIAGYVWMIRRGRRKAAAQADLAMMREATGPRRGWTRHLPPALFAAALALLITALARPVAVVTLPSQYETVILAMDVSGSMRATDLEPNRLAASQAAARAFIAEQPRSTRIGVVSFAGTAALVQPPTENRDDVLAAIERFQPQRGTAVGSGIVIALATLFPGEGIEIRSLESQRDGPRAPRAAPGGEPRRDGKRGGAPDKGNDGARPDPEPAAKAAPGSYASAVIVLLTDGQTNTGPDPMAAAKLAADRGVRVYTVGIGSARGDVVRSEGMQMRVGLDEETLKSVSRLTHGEYFKAGSASDLRQIYSTLNSRFVFEKRQTEVTALFIAAAAALAVLSAMLSLAWFNRVL